MKPSLPAPDFLVTRERPSAVAWAAMAAATLLAATAGLDAWQAWTDRDRAVQAREQAEAASRHRTQRAPATRTSAVDRTERTAALQRVSARLDHPWREVFLSTEAASGAGIAWLALEHGDGGRLRLEGTAVDVAGALRAARALQGDALWRDVLVSRLERNTGDAPQRFELSAQLGRAR